MSTSGTAVGAGGPPDSVNHLSGMRACAGRRRLSSRTRRQRMTPCLCVRTGQVTTVTNSSPSSATQIRAGLFLGPTTGSLPGWGALTGVWEP